MFQSKYDNYDKHPSKKLIGYDDALFHGYHEICAELQEKICLAKKEKKKIILSLDYYPGVHKDALLSLANALSPDYLFNMDDCAKTESELEKDFSEFITEDRVFGVMCHRSINSFYEMSKLDTLKNNIASIKEGLIIIIGFGVRLVASPDLQVYAGITRWEIQLRFRKGDCNFMRTDSNMPTLSKYKRGFFIEWRIADQYKYENLSSFDYYLETEDDNSPKLITLKAYLAGLQLFANEPFRMEPYFDPGVWGGHWMQDNFGLDKDKENFAWSFDGVPEENAINIEIANRLVKLPALDVVYNSPIQLLGNRVHARFGREFPIRFDMLDTMGGENLSLQVHPLTEYIQNKFGMHYTQDESYYILDTVDPNDAYVYLGVKNDVSKEDFTRDLLLAESGQISFPAEKYVNKIPVKPHDHVLIPAGTVHCSGKNVMVLEISATPYIFTFKLWDWDRLGLDGLPRPIHVEHGLKNIQWNRDTDFVLNELVHQEKVIEQNSHSLVEETGLHEREFIQTVRYSISATQRVEMNDSVHVMNLVSGSSCYIKSVDNSFEPFEVHYAETTIVPAKVGSYYIVPAHEDEEIKMVVASIR